MLDVRRASATSGIAAPQDSLLTVSSTTQQQPEQRCHTRDPEMKDATQHQKASKKNAHGPCAQDAWRSARCQGLSVVQSQVITAVLMATSLLAVLLMAPGTNTVAVNGMLAHVWVQRFPQQVGSHVMARAKGVMRRTTAAAPQPPDRMIVAATLHPDEAKWLEDKFAGTDIHYRVYVAEFDVNRRLYCRNLTATNSSQASLEQCWPHLASGKSSEGSAYLQYIIDEYDNGLPLMTMFIHGHWESWHRPDGNYFTDVIRRLRWGEFPYASTHGWGSLGSNFWDLATWVNPADPESCHDQTKNGPGAIIHCGWQGVILRDFWVSLGFNDTFGLPPQEVRSPGLTGEFIVRRDRIYLHPKSYYVDLLHRINSFEDNRQSGFAMEHMYHAIFGEPWSTWGIGKCQLIHCSPEEEADAENWPPPTPVPFAFHKVPDPFKVPDPAEVPDPVEVPGNETVT